jgi:hypothetical protein
MEVKSRVIKRPSIIVAGLVLLLAVEAVAEELRAEISMRGTGFLPSTPPVRARFNGAQTRVASSSNAGLSRVQARVHQATGGLVIHLPSPPFLRVSPYVPARGRSAGVRSDEQQICECPGSPAADHRCVRLRCRI